MNQTRLDIHADVALRAEVQLLALAALLHLRAALAAAVLVGTGRCNQGGVQHRAALEHHALGAQHIVDGLQDLDGQLVLLQRMPEPMDGDLIGQPLVSDFQTRKLAEHRYVTQRFLNRRITLSKQLPPEVNEQHAFGRELRAATPAFRREPEHPGGQVSTRYDFLDLARELPVPRSLVRYSQNQAVLHHGSYRLRRLWRCKARHLGIYEGLP